MILRATHNNAGLAMLEDLGLDVQTIHDALLYAYAERSTYTELDAPGVRGTAFWSRTGRRLAEIYTPKGWIRIQPYNQPTIVHPTKKHCLVVASGDVHTGSVTGKKPSTKNPRGKSFREAIDSNAVLMELQDVDETLEGITKTWVLLYLVTDDGKIYSEVSLPSNMTGDFISDWEPRILIPVLDLQDVSTSDPESEKPDYDFKIERK